MIVAYQYTGEGDDGQREDFDWLVTVCYGGTAQTWY